MTPQEKSRFVGIPIEKVETVEVFWRRGLWHLVALDKFDTVVDTASYTYRNAAVTNALDMFDQKQEICLMIGRDRF